MSVETDKLAWVDTGVNSDIENQLFESTLKKNNDFPTDEEIGKAVRTLQKVGINPINYINGANNEYLQLNSMLNSSNNEYSNDYVKMMMLNNQSNGQMSPQMMQIMMQQQMMGGFGF